MSLENLFRFEGVAQWEMSAAEVDIDCHLAQKTKGVMGGHVHRPCLLIVQSILTWLTKHSIRSKERAPSNV
jgi:UDP-2,3-diacylglucosamine pyrophosphatase LpxH